MEPTIEHHKRVIQQRAEQLARDAQRLGVVLTVEQVPQIPLAQGNYQTQVRVRAALNRGS